MNIILCSIIGACLGTIIVQNYSIIKTTKELVSIHELLQNILDFMYMNREI